MKILPSFPRVPAQPVVGPAATVSGVVSMAATSDGVDLGSGEIEKEWTVLVWANGKANGADRLAPSVLRELETAGSNDSMDIVAQLGRKQRIYDKVTKDWSGVRRYHVERNETPYSSGKELSKWFLPPYTSGIVSPVVEDLGDADMGSAASFADFLKWGMKEYPAKHYAVVVYGEGGGMVGTSNDETSGHGLTPADVQKSFADAKESTGRSVDLVAFDSSYGAGIETAHQLKDVADVMVGSQAPVRLGSLQLDMVMKDLQTELATKGSVSPEQLAKWFVFETRTNSGPMAALVNPTLSAIDLKKIDAVKVAYGRLADELSDVLAEKPKSQDALRMAISDTQNYAENQSSGDFYGDYRDLGHFAKNLQRDVRLGDAVHEAAETLLEATRASIIDEAHVGLTVSNSTGLSGYLPLDAGFDLHQSWKAPTGFDPLHGYQSTTVGGSTQWAEVLKSVAVEKKGDARLRKLGLGDTGIVRTNKVLNTLKKLGSWAFAGTAKVGSYQAYKFARGKQPGNYFGIPVKAGVPLAVVGGARDAFLGAKQIVKSVGDDTLTNKKAAVIDGSLATLGGLAVGTAAAAYLLRGAAFLTQPAGIVAVAAPIAKIGYGIYEAKQAQSAAKDRALASTPSERLAQLETNSLKTTFVSPVLRWLAELGPGDLD